MRTYLQFKQYNRKELPEQFRQDDVRYADEFVRHFLTEFSNEGDVVFDPFVGFGTTLIVAEEMSRQGYGLEFDPERCKYVQPLLAHPENLICGDATRLSDYQFPMIDLSITSPPYMNKFDHPENPLTAYSTASASYDTYLQGIQNIYRQIAALMKPAARVIIEVSNLKTPGGVTPLAWDITQAVSKVLQFEGETVLCWDKYSFGYDHSYCLIFSLLQQSIG
jgi:DNA modification methylase